MILAPAEHAGGERLCVAERVSEIGDADRFVIAAERGKPGRRVGCRRPNGGTANVVVLVEDPADLTEIKASVASPSAPDVEERLRLRVVGLDARGETPNAIFVGAEERVLGGIDDPHPRPSRCCRDRRRSREVEEEHPEPLPPHPGFDFDTWTEHVGTMQSCIVAYDTSPQRVDAEHAPPVRTPREVVIQMYAQCAWDGGTKHLRLFFDADAAPSALWVGRGGLVRGNITGSGDLWVRSVNPRPAPYEGIIEPR